MPLDLQVEAYIEFANIYPSKYLLYLFLKQLPTWFALEKSFNA